MKKIALIGLLAIHLTACDLIYLEDSQTHWHDRYTGSYRVEEYSHTYQREYRYTVWIDASYGDNRIWIDNFYDEGICVEAFLRGDQLTLPRQTVNGFVIEGTGMLYSHRLTLNFSIRDTYSSFSRTDFCELTGWRD